MNKEYQIGDLVVCGRKGYWKIEEISDIPQQTTRNHWSPVPTKVYKLRKILSSTGSRVGGTTTTSYVSCAYRDLFARRNAALGQFMALDNQLLIHFPNGDPNEKHKHLQIPN